VTSLFKRLASGRLPEGENEAVLGAVLAEKVGAVLGQEVRLSLPTVGAEGGDGQGGPRFVSVKVVGTIRLGMHDLDSKYLFAPIASVQNFLNQPGKVTTFKIKLKSQERSRSAEIAGRLNDAFGYPFRAKDWSMLHKNLFAMIVIEKAVLAIIMTAIIVVSAFNVISTLMMMIHDKAREMAILKAMGFSAARAFRLFLLLGSGIGVVGVLGGVGLGLLLNTVLDRAKLIDIPPQVYNLDHLPVITRWHEVLIISGVTLVIVLGATLYPAIRVARKSPLDGLRYD
jgi:lipoprotein-releasing system permease protein